jgi:hypothetical protein
VCFAVSVRLVSAQSPSVQEHYDTSRTQALTGRVSSVVYNPQRTYVVLAVAAEAGKEERWAVAGRNFSELGWTPKSAPVKIGDTVSFVVYRARPGAKVAATVPVDHTPLVEIATAGRLVHGTEIMLPNGSKLAFGER